MEAIKVAVENLAPLLESFTTGCRNLEAAMASIDSMERVTSGDWKRFVDENATMGIEVEELLQEATNEHAVEIRVYPYGDNMI